MHGFLFSIIKHDSEVCDCQVAFDRQLTILWPHLCYHIMLFPNALCKEMTSILIWAKSLVFYWHNYNSLSWRGPSWFLPSADSSIFFNHLNTITSLKWLQGLCLQLLHLVSACWVKDSNGCCQCNCSTNALRGDFECFVLYFQSDSWLLLVSHLGYLETIFICIKMGKIFIIVTHQNKSRAPNFLLMFQ